MDLVKSWGWRSFTIIYETNEGLVRLQELLKAYGSSDFPTTVRQLTDSGDFRPLLKQIKNSAEAHIILDCNTEKIYEVLKQAQQIGMMSDYHSYLITSLVYEFSLYIFVIHFKLYHLILGFANCQLR